MSKQTVTVTATGQSERIPSLATLKIAATGTGESAASARTSARDLATTVRKSIADCPEIQHQSDGFINETGDPASSSQLAVKTTGLKIKDTNKVQLPNAEFRFQATQRLCIKCSPEIAGELAVAVTDAGGTIRVLEYQLRDSIYEEARDEALSRAMNRASEKAELIANKEGLEVVTTLNATMTDAHTDMADIVTGTFDSDLGTSIDLEPVSVAQSVEVTYKIS